MIDYQELIQHISHHWGVQLLYIEIEDVNSKNIQDIIHTCETEGIWMIFKSKLKYLREFQQFPISNHYIIQLDLNKKDVEKINDLPKFEKDLLTNKVKCTVSADLSEEEIKLLGLPIHPVFSKPQLNPSIQEYIGRHRGIGHIHRIGEIRNKRARYKQDQRVKFHKNLDMMVDQLLRRSHHLRKLRGIKNKLKDLKEVKTKITSSELNSLGHIFNVKPIDTAAISHLPSHEILSKEYKTFDCLFDKMNGSIEWKSAKRIRRRSTLITKAKFPMKISAQFSGSAKYIGFQLGQNRAVMTTMERPSHVLSLVIGTDGSYHLEKDQKMITPIYHESVAHPPAYITGLTEIFLTTYFIDGSMITQRVVVSEATEVVKKTDDVHFSVVVACTKYSRRLQQLIQSIAQQNYDLSKLEIVVAFVPGLDTTEDIMDTTAACWPELNLMRVPFSLAFMTHKWAMINQAIAKSSGKRILVTDADIVFPPDLFAKLSSKYVDAFYLGVSGRKMLSPATTAKILHGSINPSREFETIMKEDNGELRIDEAKGKPVGYFQCFTREVAEKVKYRELPHFEGSDGFFTEDVRKAFRKETIADDIIVLHLDHQGSRWYGTEKQM